MAVVVLLRKRVHVRPDADAGASVLYVPIERRSDPAFIDAVIHGLPFETIRAADRIVLRLHPRDAQAFSNSSEKQDFVGDIAHRVGGRPTSILGWEKDRFIFRDLITDEPEHNDALMQEIRDAELWAIAHQPGCLLEPVDEFHYEGPNGSHYQGFLRPGLALLSTDILDAVAFWLLPQMKSAPAIIADTGHLLSLAQHAQRYARTEQALDSTFAAADALRGYAEPSALLQKRLSEVHAESSTDALLLLVSVRSSGQLADRVKELAQQLWTHVTTVSLYGITSVNSDGSASDPVMCSLPARYQRLGKKPCTLCQAGVPLVRVDPHTYLLEVSAVADRKNIGSSNADAARSFMERYSGLGAVTLHKTRTDPHEPPRHHTVHLDIGALMRRPVFWDALLQQVATLQGSFQVIVSPSHPAAVRLAERVGQETGRPTICVDEDQIGSLPGGSLQLLKDATEILIIDDVVSTGTRLRGYKYHLREVGAAEDETTIHLLVGVARTSTRKQLSSIRDMLMPRGVLLRAEDFLLPDWNDGDCPWCREQKLLVTHSGLLGAYLADRLHRLRQVEVGLSDDVFIHWDRAHHPMKLGPRSVFGSNLNQAELFLVVASALQDMRSSGALSEHPQPPLARVLAPDGYLTGRYYEDTIDAAICRAAKRHDLRTSTMEPELMNKVARRLAEPFSVGLRGELLIAISDGKLPVVPGIAAAIATGHVEDQPFWLAVPTLNVGPN
jgi:hypothetical protein